MPKDWLISIYGAFGPRFPYVSYIAVAIICGGLGMAAWSGLGTLWKRDIEAREAIKQVSPVTGNHNQVVNQNDGIMTQINK